MSTDGACNSVSCNIPNVDSNLSDLRRRGQVGQGDCFRVGHVATDRLLSRHGCEIVLCFLVQFIINSIQRNISLCIQHFCRRAIYYCIITFGRKFELNLIVAVARDGCQTISNTSRPEPVSQNLALRRNRRRHDGSWKDMHEGSVRSIPTLRLSSSLREDVSFYNSNVRESPVLSGLW